MHFPTHEEIWLAGHEQLVRWYRFLPTPRTTQEQEAVEAIMKKLKALGPVTPETSKKIGWNIDGALKSLLYGSNLRRVRAVA